MNTLRTNEIDTIEIDQSRLSATFCLFAVSTEVVDYAKRIRELKKATSALSFHKDEQSFKYFCLSYQDTKLVDYKSDEMIIKKIPLTSLDNITLLKLFIRAIPSILNKDNSVEYDGFFYPIDFDIVKGYKKIKTLKVDVEIQARALTLQGNTFNEFSYFSDTLSEKIVLATGKEKTFFEGLWKKIKNEPRYNFDNFCVAKGSTKNTSFIKRARYTTKEQYTAFDISNDDIRKFELTKTGVFATIHKLLSDAYHNAVTFTFKTYQGEKREYSELDVMKFNKNIIEIMQHNVEIDDHVRNEESQILSSALKAILKENQSTSPHKFLITHPAQHYIETGTTDPYAQSKQHIGNQHYNADNKVNKTNASTHAHALVKELFVKKEILEQQFLHDKFQFLPEFTACCHLNITMGEASREEQIEQAFLTVLTYKNRNLEFHFTHDHDAIENYILEHDLPFDDRKAMQYAIIDNTGNTFCFTDVSSVVALPDILTINKKLEDISTISENGIPSFLINEFFGHEELDDIHGTHITFDEFKKKYPIAGQLDKGMTDEEKTIEQHRRRTNKLLRKYLVDNMGELFSNLRNEKGKHLLNELTGIFIDRKNNVYCAGGNKTLKQKYEKFNRLKRIESDVEVPEFIWRSIEHFAIRNKQSTTLPFFFKHLREFMEWKIKTNDSSNSK